MGPMTSGLPPMERIYITDPFYQRSWWDHQNQEQEGQDVYYLPPGSSNLIRVIADLQQPNGIIGTAKGEYLYVSDLKGNKTWRYTIIKDGLLTGKKLFADLGSDGMAIDNRGNIYITGNGVTVFNPDGEMIAKIPIEESWTSNVCFGGKGRHLLFITAGKSVYGLKMLVKGLK